jgi:membrane-associated phospholipid phosphatase
MAGILLAPVFVFPRMFSGAHWLTDTLVGGTVFTLLAASWALATPLFYRAVALLYIPAAWKLRMLMKIRDRIFRK